jgi:hypothetical protein
MDNSGVTLGGFGGVAGFFAIFFFSDLPRLRKDVLQVRRTLQTGERAYIDTRYSTYQSSEISSSRRSHRPITYVYPVLFLSKSRESRILSTMEDTMAFTVGLVCYSDLEL